MKDLKLHVERIVRPIYAMQGRKLRMRTDLLAHLHAAVEEERQHFPDDEQAALERALSRLGEPAALTRELQRSVPLLSRFPSSVGHNGNAIEQWVIRLLGQQGFLTAGHSLLLSLIAIVCASPFLYAINDCLSLHGMQTDHRLAAVIGISIGWTLLLFACYRFTFGMANPVAGLEWSRALKRGASVVAWQIGLLFFVVFAIASRWASAGEVGACGASTVGLLVVTAVMARWISVLRRPYDEWLMLDIAE